VTNEDRIKRWLERRGAEDTAEVERPARRARIGRRAPIEPLTTQELLARVIASIAAIPGASNAERRKAYDVLAMELDNAGEVQVLTPDVIELHGRQLRIAIRMVESELREGRDVLAPGYRPDGFDEAMRRLSEGYQRRQKRADEEATRAARRRAALAGEAFPVAVQPDEEADLLYIRDRLALVGGGPSRPLAEPDPKSLHVFAAVLGYQFRLLRAESRIALMWVFVGPAVLLSLISLLYMLSGTQFILGMDVPTFSMIGATTWIMFRNIIFRTSTAIYSQRALLNLRPVSSLTIGLAQGSIYLMAYVAVFLVLIYTGNWLGAFSLPANWLGFWTWVGGMGIAGIAVGVLFGAAAVIWPYFLRFAPMIERALEIFSGVFFVSEQLPEQYRPYVLWSPFAHALQLLRSAYFTSYKSEDASPEYFVLSLGVLIIAAYAAQRAVRSRSQPM
jgi:capsular polysaccharide transport system permease protein